MGARRPYSARRAVLYIWVSHSTRELEWYSRDMGWLACHVGWMTKKGFGQWEF